jgi:glycosyltransferase involved in cell wall biosynthesis
MCRFTLELASAARTAGMLEPSLSVSVHNELFPDIAALGLPLLPVEAFASSLGAVARSYRIVRLRRTIADFIAQQSIEAVVTLMPHVWSPLVGGIIKRAGIPYCVIVHDAEGHVGDPTGLVNRWLLRDAQMADRVVALSNGVAHTLAQRGSIPRDRISVLFHPDLQCASFERKATANPLRVLFFGRILPYKGLPLFVSAVERLRARGTPLTIGIFGEGHLGGLTPRLQALNAKIVNRWIDEREIAGLFECHDVLVLSHIEASQSGLVGLALGHGMPVVMTPAGGLSEQIAHDVNGLIAQSVTAEALADQIGRLVDEPGLYANLVAAIAQQAPERSMHAFLRRLCAVLPSRHDAPSRAIEGHGSMSVASRDG